MQSPVPRFRQFCFMLGVLLLFGLGLGVMDAARQPLDFDGSYNLQVAQNFAERGEFASNNLSSYTAVTLFEPVITTGPTTMLPIASSFWLFGEGVWQFRAVMLTFYLAAAAAIGLLVFRQTGSRWSIVAPLGFLLLGHVFYQGYDYLNLRVDAVGEIPAVLFSLGACYFWLQRRGFLTGLNIGLAILSKVICAMWLPAIMVVIIAELVRKKQRFGFWTRVMAGIALPVLAWEAYRLVALGGWQGYVTNWQNFITVFKTFGSGLTEGTEAATLLDKARAFVQIMPGNIALKVLLFLIILAGVLLAVNQARQFIREYYFPLTFVALSLVWWIFMSDKDFVRHILPALIVGWALICILLIKYLYRGRIFLLSALTLFIVVAHLLQFKDVQYPVTLQDQQAFAARVATQGEGVLVHEGWWQNPEIQFLTSHRSVEHAARSNQAKRLLVVSPLMRHLSPNVYRKQVDRCKEVFTSTKGYVACGE